MQCLISLNLHSVGHGCGLHLHRAFSWISFHFCFFFCIWVVIGPIVTVVRYETTTRDESLFLFSAERKLPQKIFNIQTLENISLRLHQLVGRLSSINERVRLKLPVQIEQQT